MATGVPTKTLTKGDKRAIVDVDSEMEARLRDRGFTEGDQNPKPKSKRGAQAKKETHPTENTETASE
jgi:hypothetical protein